MITARLEDLRQERAARRTFARSIFDKLLREEFYTTNQRELETVIRSAQRDEHLYAQLLGEPMPGHLRTALETEVLEWMGLYDVLVRAPVAGEDYSVLCARLRPRSVALIDLLDVEMEMLTNPLAHYYLRWLREYRETAR